MEWRRRGNRIFFGRRFISKVDSDMVLTCAASGQRKDFSDLFALIGQVNNSRHTRNGCFWIERADGKGQLHAEKLPLEQAMEKVLVLFASAKPKAAAPGGMTKLAVRNGRPDQSIS